MKKLLFLAIIFFLLIAVPAFAADVTLSWDASQGATSYKIYLSSDNGATWDAGTDVGNVTTFVYPGVAETGLILFKISSVNSTGESISHWRGAWFDYTRQPPDYAPGLGVQ